MEIISHTREGLLELQLKGRLDANWADHLGNAIESAIRAGQHHIDLDLAAVNYLSSAGIRVLLKYLRQLKTAHGALRVVRTTEPILSVLQLSGIANLLEAGGETAAPAKAQPGTRRWERNGAVFESHDQTNGRGLDGRLHGHPENFAAGQLSVAESRRVRFNPSSDGGPTRPRGQRALRPHCDRRFFALAPL